MLTLHLVETLKIALDWKSRPGTKQQKPGSTNNSNNNNTEDPRKHLIASHSQPLTLLC